MNTTHTQQTAMDIDSIIQALVHRFGDTIVTTQESQQFIESLGQDPSKYYYDLRARFRVGHGKLKFYAPQNGFTGSTSAFLPEVEDEPLADIEKRLNARFNALEVMSPDNWKELASMTCMKNS